LRAKNLDTTHRWVYDFLFKQSADMFAQYYSEVCLRRPSSISEPVWLADPCVNVQGTVLENYIHILSLLLRLRQVCDQPLLVALSALEKQRNLEAFARGQRKRVLRKFSYYEMGQKLKQAYGAAPGMRPLNTSSSAPCAVHSPRVLADKDGSAGENTTMLSELLGVAELCRLCYDEVDADKVETSCGHIFHQDVRPTLGVPGHRLDLTHLFTRAIRVVSRCPVL
jgi:hypothetical protein